MDISKKSERKEALIRWTKCMVDIMFFGGIGVVISLPASLWLLGRHAIPTLAAHYKEALVIYYVLGIAALVIVWQLRRMMSTVQAHNCFVRENVSALKSMSNWSFFIVVMSVVRSVVYTTIAMLLVILVFLLAGFFARVLACVFDEAVDYKEENDMTV